ncbi:MAG: RHS repeat-associated core domain-containing protein [Candidatus Acidiferrales bacterium]
MIPTLAGSGLRPSTATQRRSRLCRFLPRKRKLSVLHQLSGSTIDGASYTLDAAGNRTAKVNDLSGGATSNYTYDNIYELLSVVQGTNTTESYTYDPVGNRLSSLGMSPYSYNTSNELTSTSAASYGYDYNGNTTSKTVSGNTTSYAWDYENRLTSVTLPNSGGTVTFKYDPFGRRIQKAFTQGSTTTTTNYVYDDTDTVDELDQNGNVLVKYSRTTDIDEPLAESRSGTTSYYEQDGQDSITSLSGGAGSLSATYAYDSFGKLTASSGSLVNPFHFTGRELDSEVNLYYFRARYYDPTTGRFISEDPIDFSSETLNFYDYVSNNPLVFNDPSGSKKIHGKWCGPNWTGGQKEPFIPSHDLPGYYAPPIDHVDKTCSDHDKCYAKCRDKHPCSPWGRRVCERKCDFSLIGGIIGHPADVFNPWSYVIGSGIGLDLIPPAGPNGGSEPSHPVSCPSCGGSGPPPAGVH